MEDRDSERLTDVVDAVGDDALGMRIGHGTEIGGYIIDGEIGHGAMGVVYSATHPVIRKRAAIKILRLDVSQMPIAVERFIQEARAVNQIGHPNIVDIFAYGALPDGRAYHVMDLLVGESLRQRLKRSVLHPSEAASVIDEIASALMAAHDNGFVHRDLKPDNVFLVTREQRWPEVKLLDFGLAKLMPEHGVPAFRTKTGVMLGTPEYMSPEQARGHGVDYRTDVYALGIVMFEILAGSRPFPPLGEPVAVLMQHAEEPPLSLADTVAGLPAEMVQLVDAMLAKTPQARPSLAAVRTVIKRLRTTQLPTRSVAGMSMSSFSQVPARPDLAITASRLGAEAVLPEPLTASIRPRPVTTPPSTHLAPPARSAPATTPPPSTHGARSAPATTPPPSTHGARSAPATTPPPSTHGASPARSAPATSPQSTHSASPARSAPATSPPSAHSASPVRSAPETTPPSMHGASPVQPAHAPPAADGRAPASGPALDPRLPSALQRLAAASQSPSGPKPDITTRGVGVQSVWASQGGAPRFNPTPHPDVPRASPTGSQPPPIAPAPSPNPAIGPGQRATSSPGLPSVPSPGASAPASASSTGGASTSAVPRSDRIGATLLGAPGASTSRIPPTTRGVGSASRQTPATTAAPSRRRWLVIALLLVLLAGAALAVVLLGAW